MHYVIFTRESSAGSYVSIVGVYKSIESANMVCTLMDLGFRAQSALEDGEDFTPDYSGDDTSGFMVTDGVTCCTPQWAGSAPFPITDIMDPTALASAPSFS